MPILTVGSPAPAFSLLDLEGQQRSLAAFLLRGPTLLCFYKTECPTCRLALPWVQNFDRLYRDSGLQLMGIGQNPSDEIKDFVSQLGVRFMQLSDDVPYRTSTAYGLQFTPTLFLIAQTGQILEAVESWDRARYNAVSQRIADLLAAPYQPISVEGDGAPASAPVEGARTERSLSAR